MTSFSKFGTRSTGFEKGLLVLAILSVGGVVAVKNLKDAEVHSVFAQASTNVKTKCSASTSVGATQDYYDCIVESKDPQFMDAARAYMLRSGVRFNISQ